MMFNLLQMLDPVADEFEHNGQKHEAAVWPLTSEEASQLGNATALYLESVPAGQKSKLKDFLEKNMPIIMLTGTIATVAGPRAHFSFEQKRKAHIAKLERTGATPIARSGAGSVRSGPEPVAESASAETAATLNAFNHAAA